LGGHVLSDLKDGRVHGLHVAGGHKEAEEAVEPDRGVLRVPLLSSFVDNLGLMGNVEAVGTLGSFQLAPDFLWDDMKSLGDVPNQDVVQPDEKDQNEDLCVKEDEEEGPGGDPEENGIEEEWKVASDQIDVLEEGLLALELSKVDIEDVDGD
jgi:hypothetical protein